MGWNQLNIKQNKCPLFSEIDTSIYAYFCHSFYVKPIQDHVIACTTEYGIEFTSAICQDNIFGVQFHPEKSQLIGLKILENFVNI